MVPTLFGIVFVILLKHASGPSTEGMYLRTRSYGKFFSLTRWKTKTKIREKPLRNFLCADDAAATTHSADKVQQHMNRFSSPWKYFRLTINLKKTQVTGQDVTSPPSIKIFDQQLEVVHDSTSICSTWRESLWLRDIELNKRIEKVATTVFSHSKRATNWPNTPRSWYVKLACWAPSRVLAIPWLFVSTRNANVTTLNSVWLVVSCYHSLGFSLPIWSSNLARIRYIYDTLRLLA